MRYHLLHRCGDVQIKWKSHTTSQVPAFYRTCSNFEDIVYTLRLHTSAYTSICDIIDRRFKINYWISDYIHFVNRVWITPKPGRVEIIWLSGFVLTLLSLFVRIYVRRSNLIISWFVLATEWIQWNFGSSVISWKTMSSLTSGIREQREKAKVFSSYRSEIIISSAWFSQSQIIVGRVLRSMMLDASHSLTDDVAISIQDGLWHIRYGACQLARFTHRVSVRHSQMQNKIIVSGDSVMMR